MCIIKQFQSMILAELANHFGPNISEYSWILELGALPKFDHLCISDDSHYAHIEGLNNTTLCGKPVYAKKRALGSVHYCSQCMLK